ncbi:4-(cytidine 5'-diphospho)-2-C-methyl-D-erythritol kinase [Desulfococcus sp.]|uniref:4-(cytidine 5'-diphospho)-2-C-methyl-D-erythritol kinase n=1 Tax=Desulfococcus sp. TaxID=2025834 RepID=UPI003593DFFB
MKNRLQHDAAMLRVQSPAKINLFLHVTAKRPDGYHDLYSLMCPITLSDTLTLTFGHQGVGLTCDHPGVPSDERNLAWRAAALFLDRMPSGEGVHILLEKRIPVSAGLGGGSSNAAAVLTALNRRSGCPFSLKILMEMGRSLGADVPFFLLNRPAIAEGIGDRLTAYDRLDRFFLVLLGFSFGVSTANVYKNLNLGLTKCKKANTSFPLEKGQDFDILQYLCNDLETVTIHEFPEIDAAKAALMKHGSAGALMSGSGPTVFGLFHTAEKRDHALASLSAMGNWRAYSAELMVRPIE